MQALSPLERDRVRRNTDPELNARIDERIARSVRLYAGQPREVITQRISELEREWDIERVLETNGSTLALAGVALSILGDRKWLLLSAGVLGFLFLHGTQGWCPPLPALRRMGVRTRDEINREKFALKQLRGDFEGLEMDGAGSSNFQPERLAEVAAN